MTGTSRKPFPKLLVANHVDAGDLRVNRSDVENLGADRRPRGSLRTSAKRDLGYHELKQAILAPINWAGIPCRTMEIRFTRLREEIIPLSSKRHARYWMAQAFPVMLVIRASGGEVRWMEVRDWLKRESDNGEKPVRQIVFEGDRFDVMGVRRWREAVLQQTP